MTDTVLFFDIDGTLVDNHFSAGLLYNLLAGPAREAGLSFDMLLDEIGLENQRRQEEDPDHPLTMDWDDIVETVAARYNLRPDGTVLGLWQELAASGQGLEVLDEAPDVLRKLRGPARRLVIATKGLSKYQIPILQTAGLHGLFDDYLTPDLTGHLKTQPAYFARYTARPARCRFIQIGDHYYDDNVCARRNGFYSVLRVPIHALADADPFARPALLQAHAKLLTGWQPEYAHLLPDAVIISLAELPQVIAALEARP